ncbi:LytTR family DNA-binding domain-containing protein [Cohnella sp. AR92]|uniref:LytTR family DNA-binding domain-containing protein n=1 Tax=Cohnella sp. AR92 TaxID=648716 RepID=UPI000F8CE1EF|nr:LytTR family DNA-binding domain-containing protein [Cohnella sp. AR92]RUS44594.1 LytTR family transcriptional regulator [Cohnella sp. AR92]
MKLFVTRDRDVGKIEVSNLPIEDVLFLQHDKKYVSVHTMEQEFFVPGSLSHYEEALQAAGYDFRMVDRNILVNVPKIKLLDTIFSKAYFESEISDKSKSITLAQVHFQALKSEFKMVHGIAFV